MSPPEVVEHAMTNGSYNENAHVQKQALSHSIDLLVAAAAAIPLTPGRPVQIADLGASHGINSIAPVKTILSTLSSRTPPGQRLEVVITHEDLPSNDFHSLLQLINDPHRTYTPQGQGPGSNLAVFSQLIGKSFYERLFPRDTLHLTFSFTAMHWLSVKPSRPCGSIFMHLSQDAALKAEYSALALRALTSVLHLRAEETVAGGAFVAHFPIMDEQLPEGSTTWTTHLLDEVVQGQLAAGRLSQQELGSLFCPAFLHSEAGVREVLEAVKQLWSVKSFFVRHIVPPYYANVLAGEMTVEELAETATQQRAAVFKGFMVSQLALTRGPEEAAQLGEDIFKEFKNKLAAAPKEDDGGCVFVYMHLQRTEVPV